MLTIYLVTVLATLTRRRWFVVAGYPSRKRAMMTENQWPAAEPAAEDQYSGARSPASGAGGSPSARAAAADGRGSSAQVARTRSYAHDDGK